MAAAPTPAAATPLLLAMGLAAPVWLVDAADEEAVPVALVMADVAAELTAEADVFAEGTAVDAAVEAAPEGAAPVVEGQAAALGREVTPAPAQSCTANWRVARETIVINDFVRGVFFIGRVLTYLAGRRRYS